MATIKERLLKEGMNFLDLQPHRFTVALDDTTGSILGFAQLAPVNDAARLVDDACRQETARLGSGAGASTSVSGTAMQQAAPGGVWEFRSLLVLPQNRGNGVGSKIVQTALQGVAPGSAVYCTTIGKRVNFYQKAGFHEVPRPAIPNFIVLEWLAGNIVTRLFFSDRCAVLLKNL